MSAKRWFLLVFLLTATLVLTVVTLDAYGGWGSGGCGPAGRGPAFGPVGPALLAPSYAPAPAALPAGNSDCGCSGFCACGCQDGRGCRCPGARPAAAKPAKVTPKKAPAKKDCGCADGCGCGADCRCTPGDRCAEDCPCVLTAGDQSPPPWRSFGVDTAKLAGGGCRINGRPCSRDEVLAVIEKGALVDDSGKLRLTAIGAGREQVLKDLAAHPALAPYKDRLLAQAYPAGHWDLKRCGFVTDGTPTIYVQAADGKVLHRQDAYAGPEKLADAIRKADPNYDPKKDPDATKPSLLPFAWPDLSGLTANPFTLVLLTVGGMLLLRNRGSLLTLFRKVWPKAPSQPTPAEFAAAIVAALKAQQTQP